MRKIEGNYALRTLVFVATEGDGAVFLLYVILKEGLGSSPSTGLFLVTSLGGSGLNSGNFASVHRAPDRGGIEGLHARSCSARLKFIVSLLALAWKEVSSPNTLLLELKKWVNLTVGVKGFSCKYSEFYYNSFVLIFLALS